MERIASLREKRAGIVTNMRTLLGTAETEKRDFSTDEDTKFAGFKSGLESLDKADRTSWHSGRGRTCRASRRDPRWERR